MRGYTVSFTDVAITAAQDLFQIEAVGTPAELLGYCVGQNTDAGDSEEELLTVRIRRVTDALTNVTAEAQRDEGDAAANADLNVNDTTALTTGAETYDARVWNIRQTEQLIWTPESTFIVEVDNAATVNLAAAPADSITTSGTLYFQERG